MLTKWYKIRVQKMDDPEESYFDFFTKRDVIERYPWIESILTKDFVKLTLVAGLTKFEIEEVGDNE